MERGACESVKKQSQTETTLKTEVEAASTSTAHIGIKTDFDQSKQESELVQSVRSEPALLVKEEILEDSSQDGNDQQCGEGASTSAGSGSMNAVCSTSLSDSLNIKYELIDIDIGPTVLQHMDIHYTINKQTMSVVTEEITIVDDCNEAMLSSGVKKESIEDKFRVDKTIPCKYYGEKVTEDDNDETKGKFCCGQQKGEKPYRCDTCDARFAQRKSLAQHIKKHTGEKPYQCDKCDARFAYKYSLLQHIKRHTGEKPYQCDTCDARFAYNTSLVQHVRSHTGEKPYLCDTCDARFAYKSTLVQHVRRHTGEKPYRCDTCDARFAQRNALVQHIRRRTKAYRCDTCDERFSCNRSLVQHIGVHTDKKPYRCDTCNARFAYNTSLDLHNRVSHM